MHNLFRSLLLVGAYTVMMFTVGCSQSQQPGSSISVADMKLFEAKTRGQTLTAACEEVKTLCESKAEGCSCYDHFCKDKVTEVSICQQLQNACVADCAGDAVCESACAIDDSKCGGKHRRHRGKHGDDDRDNDGEDADDDRDGDDDENDHDGSDCPNKPNGSSTSNTPPAVTPSQTPVVATTR